jgi:hypothetical protein
LNPSLPQTLQHYKPLHHNSTCDNYPLLLVFITILCYYLLPLANLSPPLSKSESHPPHFVLSIFYPKSHPKTLIFLLVQPKTTTLLLPLPPPILAEPSHHKVHPSSIFVLISSHQQPSILAPIVAPKQPP